MKKKLTSSALKESINNLQEAGSDFPFVSKKKQYEIFTSTFLNALAWAIEGVDNVDEAEYYINEFIKQSQTELVEMAMELISPDHPMFN
jgi:hypothetical protein